MPDAGGYAPCPPDLVLEELGVATSLTGVQPGRRHEATEVVRQFIKQNSYLSAKCDRQRRRLQELEAILAASKQRDLADQYIRQRAAYARLADMWRHRESAYLKGYRQGYMDALLNPTQPVPPQKVAADV